MAGHSSYDSDSLSTTSSGNSEDTLSPLPSIGGGTVPFQRKPQVQIGLLDLFGVQLEVTGRLLEAERRKLKVLEKEFHSQLNLNITSPDNRSEVYENQLKVNIDRIQHQYEQLQREYENTAMVHLRYSSGNFCKFIDASSAHQMLLSLKLCKDENFMSSVCNGS
ncbi:hypothetical protein CAPTEDRAFT_193295 [Capitella teleta]|uniref:Uncharacterized protein n=1 Tax=Capitella teleta TaxID=283909 RepID=R7UU11_CAPTE|nr:hypothetical protein CAPTEDRAFT_193295 [Capitella teleta]|eukprot:ELU10004.1 hypothetical protein CAPTEDRAFT_193295 [Capitella teleta]